MAMAGVMPIPPATRTSDLYLTKTNKSYRCQCVRAEANECLTIIENMKGHVGMNDKF